MDREQLIRALTENWMNHNLKENQRIKDTEKKILELFQSSNRYANTKDILFEIEELLGELTAECLEFGFHDGFITAMALKE